jgi:anti-sigma regulatory factor (Ser/Thr protein kinase)
VRGARHWATSLLTRADFGPDLIDPALIDTGLIDTVVLLVSELVTNAIHAVGETPAGRKPRVWLVIERSQALIRIEVHDTACVPVPPEASPRDDEEESGRGLEVIAALASYWGWNPSPFGKVVWCELTLGH